jgi:hypothetical protein
MNSVKIQKPTTTKITTKITKTATKPNLTEDEMLKKLDELRKYWKENKKMNNAKKVKEVKQSRPPKKPLNNIKSLSKKVPQPKTKYEIVI